MWTGELEPCDKALELALKDFVREQQWTGGGEIESIEDADGQVNHPPDKASVYVCVLLAPII